MIPVTEVNKTRIYTEYIDAWYNFFNASLGDNANIIKTANYVEIQEKDKEIDLYYKRTYIFAQISPGWIKQLS